MFKSCGKRIVLSVDDLVNGNKIPRFIHTGDVYREAGTARNIQFMMDLADKVIVTQPFLLDQLAHYYEQPKSKFVLFPNLPPYNWLGRYFNPEEKAKKFWGRRGMLRIGVISSMSHYELNEGEKTPDDLDVVVEAVGKLVELKHTGLTWVLPVGKDNKIVSSRFPKGAKVETTTTVPIRDYPNMIDKLDLDFVVVPLMENDFNNSKSNIKLIECAALGIPAIVSDTYPYDGFAEQGSTFKDADELVKLIVDRIGWYEKKYLNAINTNYKRFFADKTDYYGIPLNGYWIENNYELVGDTFLGMEPKRDKNGLVPPDIKEENENGKMEEEHKA